MLKSGGTWRDFRSPCTATRRRSCSRSRSPQSKKGMIGGLPVIRTPSRSWSKAYNDHETTLTTLSNAIALATAEPVVCLAYRAQRAWHNGSGFAVSAGRGACNPDPFEFQLRGLQRRTGSAENLPLLSLHIHPSLLCSACTAIVVAALKNYSHTAGNVHG